ncbi:hypothetical protein AAH994_14655 [Weeksellaceae bacterium A-14]
MKIFLIQALLTYILFIVGIKIYGLHSGVITFAPFLVAIILLIDLLLMFFRNRIAQEKWHLLLFLIFYELLFLIFTGHFSFTYIFDEDDDIRRLNICYAIPILLSTITISIYKKLNKATQ